MQFFTLLSRESRALGIATAPSEETDQINNANNITSNNINSNKIIAVATTTI